MRRHICIYIYMCVEFLLKRDSYCIQILIADSTTNSSLLSFPTMTNLQVRAYFKIRKLIFLFFILNLSLIFEIKLMFTLSFK